LKNQNIKNKILGTVLGLILIPNTAFSDSDFKPPNCYNKNIDHSLRIREDHLSRTVLDYFVCINLKYVNKIKDVEFYISDIPVWSISIDEPYSDFYTNPMKFNKTIVLESIRDFKKGDYKTKAILYTENGIIEGEAKTFELRKGIKSKYYSIIELLPYLKYYE